MQKLVQRQYLRGPNLWAAQSGWRLLVEDTSTWQVPVAQQDAVLARIRSVLPVTQEGAFPTARDLAQQRLPLLVVSCAVASALVRDFCASPLTAKWRVDRETAANVFLPCDEADSGLAAWNFAMVAAAVAAAGAPEQGLRQLHQRYWDTRREIRAHALNQTGIGLARAAAARGIPFYRIGSIGHFLQFGQGRHAQRTMETATDRTSAAARMLAADKLATASLLASLGLPTPLTRIAPSADSAVHAAAALGYPVVLKPRSAGKGRGVTVNVRDEAGVRAAWAVAAAVDRGGVLVERHIEGHDHRLLVVGGKLVAAARRLPAAITGDGASTVQGLIDAANRDPRRGMAFERVLEQIAVDDEVRGRLAAQGLSLDAVPAAGQAVTLRGAANLSLGGTAVDLTDAIHPDNRELAQRAARAVGLDVTGIDFQTPDLSRSWRDVRCAVLEVNSTPGLRPHMASNPARDVCGPIIEHLFPGGADGRIPTAGITGSLGKTTTCRIVAAMLAAAGHRVALTTTQGAWLGDQLVSRGDAAGGRVAARLLLDPGVDAGVFEIARGGLAKHGMVLDGVDVAAALNVLDNHVGMGGIETRDHLARVKRIVVERARKLAVLNADDPLCLAMREHARAPVALVSMAGCEAAMEHRRAGGLVSHLDEGQRLTLRQGDAVIGTLPVSELPSAWDGRYEPALWHALFAMAIGHGLGIGFDTIAGVLRAFRSSRETNPGRLNVVEGLPFKLVVDHADGGAALAALARFAQGFETRGRRILLLCSAGNRPDTFIAGMARAVAGAFDRYVCSDWDALRGRPPGEVAALLAAELERQGVPPERIHIARDLVHAYGLSYGVAACDDLVVENTGSDAGERWWRAGPGRAAP